MGDIPEVVPQQETGLCKHSKLCVSHTSVKLRCNVVTGVTCSVDGTVSNTCTTLRTTQGMYIMLYYTDIYKYIMESFVASAHLTINILIMLQVKEAQKNNQNIQRAASIHTSTIKCICTKNIL